MSFRSISQPDVLLLCSDDTLCSSFDWTRLHHQVSLHRAGISAHRHVVSGGSPRDRSRPISRSFSTRSKSPLWLLIISHTILHPEHPLYQVSRATTSLSSPIQREQRSRISKYNRRKNGQRLERAPAKSRTSRPQSFFLEEDNGFAMKLFQ